MTPGAGPLYVRNRMELKAAIWPAVTAGLLAAVIAQTVGVSTACSSGSSRPLTALLSQASSADSHRCADLLVKTEIQLAEVHGVWRCLEPGVQRLFKGTGDRALVGTSPYFTGSRFIGCDGAMCVYAMTFEATTAGTTGISETTMTIWLDGQGLVAHAAIPKAVP